MAFDPKWTVGWRLEELYHVAKNNGFTVNIVKINDIPTPMFANWKALTRMMSGPFINVCIERKDSSCTVSKLLSDHDMASCGMGGMVGEMSCGEKRGIIKDQHFHPSEPYRIPQRRMKQTRLTIRHGQIIRVDDEKEEKYPMEA